MSKKPDIKPEKLKKKTFLDDTFYSISIIFIRSDTRQKKNLLSLAYKIITQIINNVCL